MAQPINETCESAQWKEMYRSKLVSADRAAQTVQDGDWVDYGFFTSFPRAFDEALSKRMPSLFGVNLRDGSLSVRPKLFDIEDPGAHFAWNSWHMSGIERQAAAEGYCYYVPIRYSELPRYYRDGNARVDVAVLQVSPMDADGWFNFGFCNSHLSAICECAQTVIVEVNRKVPRCPGKDANGIHIRQVDMIIEGFDPALAALTASVPTEIDRTIARQIVPAIASGSCLQLGIGGMPNAVGNMLLDSDLKDLGVHTEMYVDAFMNLTLAGKVNGSQKNLDRGQQIYTFAQGSQDLYAFLGERTDCLTAPVDYVNDVRTIAAIDNFVSINNAVDIDLYGQVNAESSGTRNISGAGGQLDFVLGAYLSRGGKSFICLSSTFRDKKSGTLQSRIRPTLTNGSIVTDTRANTQYIVTEYGMVNLKGLSTWQRAEALIGIAHPDFREQLVADAEKMNIWRRSAKR